MLRRAKRLSSVFNLYCEQYGHPQFKLDKEEWRQIDYLLCITEPFYKFTTSLSKTKNVTIHNVFRVYNKLFDHLDASIRMLLRKKVPWKQAMLHALQAGRNKLKFYYTKTDEVPGNLYAIGTILAPQHKLKSFSSKEWGNNAGSRAEYKKSVEKYMETYQQQQQQQQQQRPEIQPLPRPALQQDNSDLEDMLNEDTPLDTDKSSHDELQEYLETCMFLTYTVLFETDLLCYSNKKHCATNFLAREPAPVSNTCKDGTGCSFYSSNRCRC